MLADLAQRRQRCAGHFVVLALAMHPPVAAGTFLGDDVAHSTRTNMTLDERLLAAIASGMLLGTTAGCRPAPVPTNIAPVEPAENSEPAGPVETDLNVVPAQEPEEDPRLPRPACASAFTEEQLESGRGSTAESTLQCETSCNQLQTSWGGPNSEYYRVCGPWDEGSMCCHVYSTRERRHYRGRPFVVEGSPRTGEIVPTTAWSAGVRVDAEALSSGEREVVAAAWAKAGAEEHASIASFSQFLLDLMSLGAPPSLVRGTTRAIEEEVEHAQACFGIASALSESPIGPGPIELGSTTLARSPEAILRSAIREGCIGEALAANLAAWSAPRASDATVRGVLSAIAEDEGRHAALAWEFVAWLLTVQPELSGIAHAEFDAACASQSPEPAEHESEQTGWGVIPSDVEAELNARALQEIVAPAAATLFATVSGDRL